MSGHQKRALKIGITGGIGSGKSIVCKIFSCLGIPIYDADSRAKWLTNNNPDIRAQVIALLGKESYDEDGLYNRPYVSSIVFKNELLLKKLNAIIHPIVMEDTETWFKHRQGEAYVIKEAAIMSKAGANNSLDYVIVVQAPAELRIKRILERDQRTKKEITAIIDRQISDEDRLKIADFVIENDEQSSLIPQVLALHQKFLDMSSEFFA